MLTWKTIAAGTPSQVRAYADHVFEKTLADDHMRMADYYAGRHDFDLSEGSIPVVRADTDRRLAQVLGITSDATLDREAFTNILSGHKADGSDLPGIHAKVRAYTEKDGTTRHKIAAMDFCFSAPKSVSVAWAFAATDAERNSILQAHRDAVADALKYAESVLAKAAWGTAAAKERKMRQ
ncbi:MAG TPA: relaxase domain-containing protein [Verrucomicrobiae bacterium]|nr:relaxase domain-containing protein [Verrucomicrobiae bacterium]